MAMSAAPAEGATGAGDDAPPMSDINTTPLVDVMLVLLIIFLITLPVVVQTVPLTLPKVENLATTTKPENVILSVRAEGGNCETFWGQTRMGSSQELVDRAVAKLKADIANQGGVGNPNLQLPEAHIRGDAGMPYKCAGAVIFSMQQAGFQKVAFISEPPGKG